MKKIQSKIKISTENLPYYLLRLGLACNLHCCFCNIPPESQSYPLTASKKEVAHQVEEIFRKNRTPKISISGGEPTLYRGLPGVVSMLKKRGALAIELQTNATFLADARSVRTLKRAGLDTAFVSFHTHIPRLFDALVASRGAFSRCRRGIRNLLEEKIEVVLNPVINSLTFRHLPAYIAYVHRYFPEIRALSLSVVQPRGRAKTQEALMPRYEALSPFVEKALDLADELGIVVVNPYCGLPPCVGGWHKRLGRCVEHNENMFAMKQPGVLRSFASQIGKVKFPVCKKCGLYASCNGVWQEYGLIYPDADLKPIRARRGRSNVTPV
jgi:MoaA/NifB/PqqE/SkfB family radical SAM enzyme